MSKNRMLCIMIMVLSCLFTGCNRHKEYSLYQSYDEIESVAIVYIPETCFLAGGDLNRIETQVVVASEKWITFFEDFHEVSCSTYFNEPAYYLSGNAIMIYYKDGFSEIIATQSACYIHNDGSMEFPWYFFDDEEFNSFIQSYIKPSGGSAQS